MKVKEVKCPRNVIILLATVVGGGGKSQVLLGMISHPPQQIK